MASLLLGLAALFCVVQMAAAEQYLFYWQQDKDGKLIDPDTGEIVVDNPNSWDGLEIIRVEDAAHYVDPPPPEHIGGPFLATEFIESYYQGQLQWRHARRTGEANDFIAPAHSWHRAAALAPQPELRLEALRVAVSAYTRAGQRDTAAPLLAEAIDLARDRPDVRQRLQQGMAMNEWMIGNAPRALEIYTELAQSITDPRRRFHAALYRCRLVWDLADRAEQEKARQCAEELAASSQGDERVRALVLVIDQLTSLGQREQALAELQVARRLAADLATESRINEVQLHAVAARLHGHFGQTYHALGEALAGYGLEAKAGGEPRSLIYFARIIGDAYLQLGETDLAYDWYRQAQAHAGATTEPGVVAPIRTELAQVLNEQGRFTEAVRELAASEGVADPDLSPTEAAERHLASILAAVGLGDEPPAGSLDYLRQFGNERQLNVAQVALFSRQGDVAALQAMASDEALHLQHRVASQLHVARHRPTLGNFKRGVQLLEELSVQAPAWQVAALWRKYSWFWDLLQASILANPQTASDADLRYFFSRRQRQAAAVAGLVPPPKYLPTEVAQLPHVRALQLANLAGAADSDAGPQPAKVDARTAMLQIWVGQDSSLGLLHLPGGALERIAIDRGRAELGTDVSSLVDAIRRDGEWQPIARRLSEALLPLSLTEALVDVSHLVIVADDVLADLPVHLLYAQDELLSERLLVTRSYGSRPGAPLNSRLHAPGLIVADVHHADYPPLPESGHLAKWLEQRIFDQDLQVLRGATATAERLRETVWRQQRFGFVHFATHAEAGTPEGNVLVLSDRVLDLRELQERPWSTQLLFLAACDTNVAPVQAAAPKRSITFAGTLAGAEFVIATNWPVDDVVAARFAERFYAHAIGGASIGEAFAAAQRHLMNSWLHRAPVHWAAFELWTTRAREAPPRAAKAQLAMD